MPKFYWFDNKGTLKETFDNVYPQVQHNAIVLNDGQGYIQYIISLQPGDKFQRASETWR